MAKQTNAAAAGSEAAVPAGPEGTEPYTLRLPHWHAGAELAAGDIIYLYPDQVARVRAAEERLLAQVPGAIAGVGDA